MTGTNIKQMSKSDIRVQLAYKKPKTWKMPETTSGLSKKELLELYDKPDDWIDDSDDKSKFWTENLGGG